MTIKGLLINISSSSNTLDKKIYKNVIKLLIYKLISISITFILVPLLIDYLDGENYGIWLTIISIATWINYFDIGIGQGLINKVTKSITENNIELARSYISSAYFFFTIILLAFYIVSSIFLQFLNWEIIFNISNTEHLYLNTVINVLLVSFIISFIFNLNRSIAYSVHEASYAGLRTLVFNILLLGGVILIIKVYPKGNLFNLAIVYISTTIIAEIGLTFYLFLKYKYLRPSIKYISYKNFKSLGVLGLKFFIIQITTLVIFSTDNIIITQIFGPSEVTQYNVIYKIFSVILIIQTLYISPLWSAFSESFVKKDTQWIKKTFKKLGIATLFLVFIMIAITILFRPLLWIWLKDTSYYNLSLIIIMGFYVLIRIWNQNFSIFLKGISDLKIQIYTAVIGAIINIPVSIFLATTGGFGIAGIALGSIISLSFFALLGPIQTKKVLSRMPA